LDLATKASTGDIEASFLSIAQVIYHQTLGLKGALINFSLLAGMQVYLNVA